MNNPLGALFEKLGSFFGSVASSVVAGVLLALLFFSWREYISPPPALSGTWHCLTYTEKYKSKKTNYEEMLLVWESTLLQRGSDIGGTSEKAYESSRKKDGKTPRDRGSIDGYLQYNYLGGDRLFLQTVHSPKEKRESTLLYELDVGPSILTGKFRWTVANQEGRVYCQKDPFDLEGCDVRGRLLAHFGGK